MRLARHLSTVRRSATPRSAGAWAALLLWLGLLALDCNGARATVPESPPAGDAGSRRSAPLQLARLDQVQRLHERLTALAEGRVPRVTVLQIGDSHTAADYLTGRLRQRLQERFGNGGRGLLPPGAPYAYFRAEQVAVSQSGAWQVLSSNKPLSDATRFGLSGYVLRSIIGDDTITIEDRSQAETLVVGYDARLDGGNFEVIVDGETYGQFSTTAAAGGTGNGRQVLRIDLEAAPKGGPAKARTITLRSYGDGLLDIMDLALERDHGVQVVNMGFIGAQAGILKRWHWPTVSAQLAALDPALIVLAFGTNEGFAPSDAILGSYEATFEAQVKVLQSAAPSATLVILGPPHAARYPRFCLPPPPPLANAATASPPEPGIAGWTAALVRAVRFGAVIAAWPPSEPPETAVCKPLSKAEQQRYQLMLASRDRELCRWHAPPALDIVRDVQRRIAERLGLFFFDWAALLDGECGVDRWARQGLAAKDRVHFRQEGYARVADALHDALLAGFGQPARRP